MSRYDSASHVFYGCQSYIVWTSKYRFKILKRNIAWLQAEMVTSSVRRRVS